ncbi:MAG: DsbA family protein [Chloroflexi bacterium]|nr:DsbA family protein [Chloroflexota bacterium]
MAIVDVVHHTDPACSWCWGLEPTLRRLQVTYGPQLQVTRRMGGIIPSLEWLVGRAYMARRARQIARYWLEVSRKVGMPIDPALWRRNPPESTWPANIAYKAAQFQDPALADRYLRRLREAALLEGRNIGEYPVLLDLAGALGLRVGALEDAIESGRAKEAFFEDVREGHRLGVAGFPTVFVRLDGREVKLEGWKPYAAYEEAVERVSRGRLERRPPPDLLSFLRQVETATTQEVAAVLQQPLARVRGRLVALESAGAIRSRRLPRATVWLAAPPRRTVRK